MAAIGTTSSPVHTTVFLSNEEYVGTQSLNELQWLDTVVGHPDSSQRNDDVYMRQ